MEKIHHKTIVLFSIIFSMTNNNNKKYCQTLKFLHQWGPYICIVIPIVLV